MATYSSSTKTNNLSATGILAGMAASTTRAPAQRPGNPEPPSRVFNPYDINVMSAARAAGCDSDSSDGGRDRWGIGGSSSDEDGLWRVPRTHNRTAERRAAREGPGRRQRHAARLGELVGRAVLDALLVVLDLLLYVEFAQPLELLTRDKTDEIGRASCRERV